MTEQKHTPGPWNVFEDTTRFPGIEASRLPFSIVVFGGPDEEDEAGVQGRTQSEALANARLIAAAPDLLEALQMVRDADNDRKTDGFPAIPPIARAKIDAAIAKAEGEE